MLDIWYPLVRSRSSTHRTVNAWKTDVCLTGHTELFRQFRHVYNHSVYVLTNACG